MKKKNFVTLIVGTVGGLLFAVGMCMCLLPEWNAFAPGAAVTAVGALCLLVLLAVRWRMDGRRVVFNWPVIGKTVYGTVSALVLGLGMCMIMVWQMMLAGILVGTAGIVMLLCLIPMCLGLKSND